MYSSKLVVAIKHNGRVLREHGDTVRIPFGAEYSLFIKNKNSVRCLVSVEIDGQDATEGIRLIVPANGSIDLERFIKNGNMNVGNRFKFIERTSKIEQHRGIGAEDGLIRVEYEFERMPAPIPQYTPSYEYYANTGLRSKGIMRGSLLGGDNIGNLYNSVGTMGLADGSSLTASYSATSASVNSLAQTPVNDAGITVAGSQSDQSFTYGAWFPTDGVKHVMVLRVAGQIEGQPVKAPVTVKAKPTCTSCGTVNKGNAKFCRECGTSLSIL